MLRANLIIIQVQMIGIPFSFNTMSIIRKIKVATFASSEEPLHCAQLCVLCFNGKTTKQIRTLRTMDKAA